MSSPDLSFRLTAALKTDGDSCTWFKNALCMRKRVTIGGSGWNRAGIRYWTADICADNRGRTYASPLTFADLSPKWQCKGLPFDTASHIPTDVVIYRSILSLSLCTGFIPILTLEATASFASSLCCAIQSMLFDMMGKE